MARARWTLTSSVRFDSLFPCFFLLYLDSTLIFIVFLFRGMVEARLGGSDGTFRRASGAIFKRRIFISF